MDIDFDKIPFLANTSDNVRKDIAKYIKWYSLPGGWPLFFQGDDAENIWFVRTGSLGAFRTLSDGSSELVGHIKSGQPVGEMAIIAEEPHSASVFALRDSELYGLSKDVFENLIKLHPELMNSLAKTIMHRLRNSGKASQGKPKVFSFFSTSPTIDILWRARAIAEELKNLGQKVVVLGDEAINQPADWFDEVERNHDIIIMASELRHDTWSQICMRQADRIWLFARADAMPSRPLFIESISGNHKFKMVDVIFLRDVGKAEVSNAGDWMEAANANRIFNWRQSRIQDLQSLARVICGKSVGLVLSGGGARAYAHIGAIRALREAGYNFDFISGTSMGAVIAACVGMGWDDQEIEQRIWDAFVVSDPINDYHLPVTSLATGHKVDSRLEKHFGKVIIEDLERPFFCVSSNLANGKIKIHRNGSLRDALRATISLPGILPPVAGPNEVLVDGAVLNNFPIDIMTSQHKGINIGIDVTQQNALPPDEFINTPSFMQWVMKYGFRSPPPIAELLMRTATVPIDNIRPQFKPDILIVPELGNIALRDWKAFDETIEAGYSATVKAIQKLNEQKPL